MIVGEVSGRLWCSQQEATLQGLRFALVLDVTNGREGGRSLVAADLIGAGIGERVLVVTGGAATKAAGASVDAAVVGLIDSAAEDEEGR